VDRKLTQKLGERLKKVREELDLTLGEVAEKLGFKSYQILSNIEDGSREVKAHELAAIAKIYLKDISYFMNENQDVNEKSLVFWRDSISDKKLKALKEQEFLKYCHNYFELEEKFDLEHKASLPNFNLSLDSFNYEKSEEIAARCYKELQLGSRPACCLETILEQKYNIKILYLDLTPYGSAACTMGYFGSAILINSSEPLWRRNYDLAHELFHLLTWDLFTTQDVHMVCDPASIIEKFANIFASTLLLPMDEVKNEIEKRIVDNQISDVDIIGVAREFMVSTEALIWRLVNLRFIKQKDASEWLSKPEIKALDRQVRQHDRKEPPRISDRYVNLAFKAYQQGLISKGKLSEYLNVDRIEVESKLSEYGYVEGEVYNGTLTLA